MLNCAEGKGGIRVCRNYGGGGRYVEKCNHIVSYGGERLGRNKSKRKGISPHLFLS